eukprot:13708716-Alexandrium_andersonii.AAC.1
MPFRPRKETWGETWKQSTGKAGEAVDKSADRTCLDCLCRKTRRTLPSLKEATALLGARLNNSVHIVPVARLLLAVRLVP